MSTKRENIAKQFKNPRTRMIYIALGTVIVMVIASAYMIVSSRSASRIEVSAVTTPPQMDVTSGMQGGQLGQATPAYDELMVRGDAQVAEQAKQTGGSAIPTPRTGVAATIPEIDQSATSQHAQPSPVTTGGYSQYDAQAEQQRQQLWEQQVQARVAAMQGQLSKIGNYWTVVPHERFQVQVAEPAPTSAGNAGNEEGTQVSAYATRASAPDIAMGEVLYATLDFGINTDDPASTNFIQATIHAPGPFEGARVLGSLQRGDQYSQTVGIHFTQMKVPGESGKRQIDAWAVSPDTQRVSMASDVNNHYMSRGFATLVGSFVEGYSTGLLAGGRQQNVVAGPNGSILVQQDAFTDKQLLQIAAGNVGQGMSQMFAGAASRQRTVTVNPGADLGVWFLKDVSPNQQ